MRGFRSLGKIEHVSPHDFEPGDLLFFAPDEEGLQMRTGAARARDFDLFSCKTAVVLMQCPSDYVFVPVAIGEDCFK